MDSFLPPLSPNSLEKDGIDRVRKWRDVLCMILANRAQGDLAFISALGSRLHDYGFTHSAQLW